ncbi:MAG TPA: phosphotransferase family protein [Candidatus Binatia bacterium]
MELSPDLDRHSDLRPRLERYLARVTGDPGASVEDTRRHTEGFSLETVSFTACWRDGAGAAERRRLVLRRQPAAGLLEPYDLRPQVAAMRAVAGAIAVPPVRWFEEDASVLGAPFYVMDFIDGDVPLPVLGKDGNPPIADAAEREALARDLACNLAGLHRFDWKSSPLAGFDAPRGARDAARRQLEVWRGYFERSRSGPEPMLHRALRELEHRAAALPTDGPVTVVHGDFRTGNFLRQGGVVRAVLDWEMVHLGDPVEDVAWATSRLWRGQSRLAGVLVACADFRRMYEEAGGQPVCPARLAFYDLLSGVKMAAIMLTGLRAFADGRTDDVRMAIFRHQLSGMNLILAESLAIIPSLDS